MRRLDGPDLFHLAQERPDRPMHTLKVAIVDGALGAEVVDRWVAEVVAPQEPFRLVLAGLPGSRPVWVDGGPPRLEHHVTHRELPGPGGEAELRATLSDLCGGRLDRRRPLWHLWHLTGLAGGRAALVFQVHHVVGDGGASVAIWEAIADGAPPPPPVPPRPGRATVAATVLADGARELVRLPGQGLRFARFLRSEAAVARDGGQPVTGAFAGPTTRFNGEPEPQRRVAFTTLAMADLQAARRATGATLNEVFLTVAGGAVRRHLDGLGEPPTAALTSTVPAALPERRHRHGNAVTTLYLSLGTDLVDPLERLRAVQASAASTRRATDRDPRLLPDWQRYPRLNGGLIRLMERRERSVGPAYNLIVSSVRGPRAFSLVGHPVVELRSVGPLAGHFGLNITGWSYGEDFSVSVHAYRSAADHLDDLADLVADELAALLDRAPTVPP